MTTILNNIAELRVKLFADGADLNTIVALSENPTIKGFTTNPTLMKLAGVTDYLKFAREAISKIGGRPLSLEVFSDDFFEMKRQALKLSALAPNVYVKIPITNTNGESAQHLITELSKEGVKVNVTAIFTIEQIQHVLPGITAGPSGYLSVFAGRIADAGIDPVPTMSKAVKLIENTPQIELIWASPREALNIIQADECGCHIITLTHDLIKKSTSLGKDLLEFSIDTVKMFANDARNAGFEL